MSEEATIEDAANVALMLDQQIQNTIAVCLAKILALNPGDVARVEIGTERNDAIVLRNLFGEIISELINDTLQTGAPYSPVAYNLTNKIQRIVRDEVRRARIEYSVEPYAYTSTSTPMWGQSTAVDYTPQKAHFTVKFEGD